jgi:hypothetical protein
MTEQSQDEVGSPSSGSTAYNRPRHAQSGGPSASSGVLETDQRLSEIDEWCERLLAYLRRSRARRARLATISIIASAIAAMSTAGPAAGGEKFTTGAQHALRLGDDGPVYQVLCASALVAALVAAIAVNLLRREDSSNTLQDAEKCIQDFEKLYEDVRTQRKESDETEGQFRRLKRKASEFVYVRRRPGRSYLPERLRAPVLAGGVVVVVLASGVLVGFALGSPGKADAEPVYLEADAQVGPAPFTDPVGEDQQGMAVPPWAGGTHVGTASALYATTADHPTCDQAGLVRQVTSDPTKEAAWASPLGLAPDDVAPFVTSLTPVLLRADTAVTDYGYSQGVSHAYSSILQEGTAVLVNSYGEPTVKCFSGDPLGRPTTFNNSQDYSGHAWNEYLADKVCRIVPAPSPVTSLVLVDSVSGDHHSVAVKADPKPVKGPNPDPAGATGSGNASPEESSVGQSSTAPPSVPAQPSSSAVQRPGSG